MNWIPNISLFCFSTFSFLRMCFFLKKKKLEYLDLLRIVSTFQISIPFSLKLYSFTKYQFSLHLLIIKDKCLWSSTKTSRSGYETVSSLFMRETVIHQRDFSLRTPVLECILLLLLMRYNFISKINYTLKL